MPKILHRMGAALAALVISTALAAPAAAAAPTPAPGVGVHVSCPTFQPFLATGFGSVKMCYRYSSTPYGLFGQAGHFSGVNGSFSPVTGWLAVEQLSQWNLPSVEADDGYVEHASLGPQLNTAYGPASWGVQYIDDSYPDKAARFGSYNWVTHTFYPTSGWLKVSP